MKLWQKLLLGGLGASMPLLLSLLTVDLQTSLQHVTKIVLVGYLIKWIVLFGVGAFVVFLYSDETNKMKIFQLGITAPALLMMFVNSNSIKPEVKAEQKMEVRSAPMPAPSNVETTWEQLKRGLTGK